MQHPLRLLTVALLLLLSSCSLDPGEPSPPAAIYVMQADGSGLERVTAEAGYDLEPAWSPDGRRIVFVRSPRTPGTAEADLVAVDANGGHETRLTSGPATDADPAWSPDGQRLAFTRRAVVPVAEPPWWQRTLAAVLGLLVVWLGVGAVVVGVVVCVLKGRPVSGLAGVLAAAAGWVTFTQAPTSRQAEHVGNVVLGIVLYGGLAALLVGVLRRARPGSRWTRPARSGSRRPARNGSVRPGSRSS